ncbi:MAG TPA: UvrD-helicase domain-containing protein [Candidatus Udaeobacter sp.]|jgi:DNA helicase-2/ATP-dependent DNA helicase PcrA|nr:UvrD-helicase domain-containing protein [Candidatus Udaeobacter sp.]
MRHELEADLTSTLTLNDAQRSAVEHSGGPLLVVAGAGSGKTRVLIARIARLLESGSRPDAVLAFTFTNRAAREMRERLVQQVGEAAQRLWVGTFHSTAVRILRREAALLDRPRDFVIYDREDQEAVMRDVVRKLELPESQFRIGALIARISDCKNALVAPEEAARLAVSPYEKQIAECYARYQARLRESGAYDFDDLIAEPVRLFDQRPEVAERYGRRFEHVLVDEYQDTNHAQFRFVQALSRVHLNLFVVGDDDQSIYGWRGADLGNVLDFERAFPGAQVIRLEQNYRSTARILRAANAVISNNEARKGKTLWCERDEGAPLKFLLAEDELEEARHVRAHVESWTRRGGRLSDCAVLYRTNAQSRAIEIEMRQKGIAYDIVGGVSFYQRREVKDVLAYLRLAVNPTDVVSFWRVWNTPRRGLGAGVRERIEERVATGIAPLEALRSLIATRSLTRAAMSGAADFLSILAELSARGAEPADRTLLHLLERTRYLEHLDDERDERAEDRRANVEELVAAASQYSARSEEGLSGFLAESALLTDQDRLPEGADRLLLLTAHNAKGLEFGCVVIAGLEEGLFPHGSSLEDAGELEEERRLFYVALTRARDEVLLTAAAYRRRFDGSRGGAVSRFVGEIPIETLEREEPKPARSSGRGWQDRGDHEGRWQRSAFAAVPASSARRPAHARAVGREVTHETFGRGVVLDAEGEGRDLKYTVRFGTQIKKVLGRFLEAGFDVD